MATMKCPVCNGRMKYVERSPYVYWECTKTAAHQVSIPGYAKCPVLVKKKRCEAPLIRKEWPMGHFECPKCGHHQ